MSMYACEYVYVSIRLSMIVYLCPCSLQVCLHDWWLIKLDMDSNGRTLGVGGLAFRERQTIRAFYSIAIAKRHDTVTLETADGITITITSFINRSITLENGFPAEVSNLLFTFLFHILTLNVITYIHIIIYSWTL